MEKDNKLGLGNEEAKANNNNNNNDYNNHSIKEEKEEEEHEEANPNLNLGSSSATENGDVLRLNVTSSSSSTGRTPFTDLSQVDADHALARTLQEQERAYMMLRFNNEGSDYGSWDAGSYFHDDDDDDDFGDPDDDDDDDGDDDDVDGDDETDGDDDVHAHAAEPVGAVAVVDLDPSMFSSDEAYARALQDAEEREMAARLFAFAGIHDQVADIENHASNNSQDTWEEVDPDELSYEELLALGEFVGSESRGLSADSIASLPSVEYKAGSSQSGNNDSCVICRIDYEDGETLTLLSCKHSYHSECINDWLKINKVCPVCSAEVSTSGHS